MRKTIFAGLLAGLLAAQGAHALSVSVDPAVLSAPSGSALAFNVRISDLGTEVLSTYDISVSFDAAILSLSSVNFGTAMNLGVLDTVNQVRTNGLGSVNLADTASAGEAALLANQADSFVLFSLNFTGIGVGTSAINLTANILGGHSDPDAFGDLFPVQLQADVIGGRAVVTQGDGGGGGEVGNVPEPTSFALAGLALLGLIGASRKRLVR